MRDIIRKYRGILPVAIKGEISVAHLSSKIQTCLFGLESLRKPNDFVTLANEAILKIKRVRHAITNELGLHRPKETLIALDKISNEICAVIDVAELCRHVHSDDEFRDAAEEAFGFLSAYIHELNTDNTLFNKLSEIINDRSIMSKLTEEDKVFALDLKAEFEAGGIHIEGQLKEKIKALKEKIIYIESSFTQNAMSSNKLHPIGPIEDKHLFTLLYEWLNKIIPQPKELTKQYILQCNSSIILLSTLLRIINTNEIRKQIWNISMNEPNTNKDSLLNLIHTRHQIAKALGFNSYLEKSLTRQVMTTPMEVNSFLVSLSDALRPYAEKDLHKLLLLSNSNDDHRYHSENNIIEPYNIPYLMELYKNKMIKSKLTNNINQYFSLNNCLEGLKYIIFELFGIKMIEIPISLEENWTYSSSTSTLQNSSSTYSKKYQNGILKYELISSDGTILGYVYLDLFQRDSKYSNAAHFTIRGGCDYDNNIAVTLPDDKYNKMNNNSHNMNRQTPIVALVFGFLPPENDSSDCFLSLSSVSL